MRETSLPLAVAFFLAQEDAQRHTFEAELFTQAVGDETDVGLADQLGIIAEEDECWRDSLGLGHEVDTDEFPFCGRRWFILDVFEDGAPQFLSGDASGALASDRRGHGENLY